METKKLLTTYEQMQTTANDTTRPSQFLRPPLEKNHRSETGLVGAEQGLRKEYAAEALIPIVAANPALAAMLPFAVGGFFGLQMFEKGVNGLRNRDQMEYGYGFGHMLQMIAGGGLIVGSFGMTFSAYKMAMDLGPSVASWAPMIQNAASENLTLLLTNNIAALLVAAVGLGIITWFLTGGPTRAGDSVANKRSRGKADIAEAMGY